MRRCGPTASITRNGRAGSLVARMGNRWAPAPNNKAPAVAALALKRGCKRRRLSRGCAPPRTPDERMASQTAKSYDYIVIGAGSAGCVLAARLTEDKDVRVLLVEAGGKDDHLYMRMPLGFLRAMLNPKFNWGYLSEPEPHLNDRRLGLPRGRVLGGSSSINGMFYMRGHPRDYDTWRQMGNEGWSYADVLPYFKRMETSWRGANKYHGDKGPLHVAPIDTRRLLHEPLVETARQLGYPVSDDNSGAVPEGFSRGEVTIDQRGRRASTSRAYLHPVMHRPNLHVETGALTSRVLIEGGRAVGVEYSKDGQIPPRPRRPRGDPLGRDLQLAAASDAVGDRAGRRAGPARHHPDRGPARRRQEPVRAPGVHDGLQGQAAGHLPEGAALRPRGPVGGAVGPVRQRPVRDPDQQLQRGAAHRPGAGAAGHPADVQPGADGRPAVVPGPDQAARARVPGRGGGAASAQPRPGDPALGQPAGPAQGRPEPDGLAPPSSRPCAGASARRGGSTTPARRAS